MKQPPGQGFAGQSGAHDMMPSNKRLGAFAHRMMTSKKWLTILAGGMVMQFNLSSCDPEVRNAFLTGVQSSILGLMDAIIGAFFLSLQDDGSSTSQPVVQALHAIGQWLA
jgi:hypothetical protein